MISEKITIDNLTEDSVSVKRQKTIIIDGVEYELGLPSRKAYMNSTRGRKELGEEVPEKYVKAILEVWGDTPTFDE